MAIRSYRNESRLDHGHSDNENATLNQIDTGSLQRIADATEKIALNYDRLISDRDMYKRWYNQKTEENKKLQASLNTYKGVVTKLKKRISGNVPAENLK